MGFNKKKMVRNWAVIARVSGAQHQYFWELCDKKGIDMSELIINSIIKANSDVSFAKGSIEDKYQKAMNEQYKSSIHDEVITHEVTKITFEYRAFALIKKMIGQSAEAKYVKGLCKLFQNKALEVYNDKKLAIVFKRLDSHLKEKLIYAQLRARTLQTTDDRMRSMLQKEMDRHDNKRY